MPVSPEVSPFVDDDTAEERGREPRGGRDSDPAGPVASGVERVAGVVLVGGLAALTAGELREPDLDETVADLSPYSFGDATCAFDACGGDAGEITDSCLGPLRFIERDAWRQVRVLASDCVVDGSADDEASHSDRDQSGAHVRQLTSEAKG